MLPQYTQRLHGFPIRARQFNALACSCRFSFLRTTMQNASKKDTVKLDAFEN
jgi:hypothetical protein